MRRMQPHEPATGSQSMDDQQADRQQWNFTNDVPADDAIDAPEDTGGQGPTAPGPDAVTWSASEYVAHQKGIGWFAGLVIADTVIAGLIYLITRDMTSTIVVAVAGIIFGAFAMRQPEVLEYAVDRRGIFIGPRFYAYSLFRSFSVMPEEPFHSILLMPQHRFTLPITVYFAPADEVRIAETIGGHLPHDERAVPMVDRLMSKIHF